MMKKEWIDDIEPKIWNNNSPEGLFRSGDSDGEALCQAVFAHQIKQTKYAVNQGGFVRSVLLYADRWVGHHLAACIKREMSNIVQCGGLDCGPVSDWGDAIYPQEQLRLMVQQVKVGNPTPGEPPDNSVYLVENFDMIYAMSCHEFDFSFMAHMQNGRRYIFIVEPGFSLPVQLERHFVRIRADRIESPAYLLPLLTADQFVRLVGYSGGTETVDCLNDRLNKCKVLLTQHPEMMDYLYLRLAELSPTDIARVLDMSVPFSIQEVDVARKTLLSERLGLDPNPVSVTTSPWLEADSKSIKRLLQYNNKNLLNPDKRVRGVILYGPPGNGKTKLIESICADPKLGWNVIVVNSADIKHSFQGESEKAIAGVFRRAAQAAPCVLVFDEMEELFRNRASSAVTESAGAHGIVTALLREMDGLGRRDGIFVIGLTNQLKSVDPAFLRNGRFEDAYLIDAPWGEHAKQAVEFFFDEFFGKDKRLDARTALKAFVENHNAKGSVHPLSVADIDHLVKYIEVRNIPDKKVGDYANMEWKHLKEVRGIQTDEQAQHGNTDNTL